MRTVTISFVSCRLTPLCPCSSPSSPATLANPSQTVRDRWVLFKKWNYDATQVPPEWFVSPSLDHVRHTKQPLTHAYSLKAPMAAQNYRRCANRKDSPQTILCYSICRKRHGKSWSFQDIQHNNAEDQPVERWSEATGGISIDCLMSFNTCKR